MWRGPVAGALRLLAVLPQGQGGFLDLDARRGEGYAYTLGDGRRPDPLLRVVFDGSSTAARVSPALVTTCSGLMPGTPFPANTQNVFVASKHPHVQYYGFFLLRPFDPSPREVRLVWRDAAGAVFSEITQTVKPKPVELNDGTAGQLLLTQAIGLQSALPQNGQTRVPGRPGLHTVEAFVDGASVALSVFYLREEPAARKAAPPPP